MNYFLLGIWHVLLNVLFFHLGLNPADFVSNESCVEVDDDVVDGNVE